MGAFVSGLDAGKIYQTWPKMGNKFFPNDIFLNNFKNFLDFDNHSLVQFYHRNLAYLIIFYIFFLTIYIYKKKLKIYKPLKILLFFLFLQVIIRNIYINKWSKYLFSFNAHQITSVLLVFSALNLYYLRAK